MSGLPGIALALEVPLTFRGGINVILEELIEQLSSEFAFTLVSPDPPEVTKLYPRLAGHIFWNPVTVSRRQSAALAAAIVDKKVKLAHFHLPGTYGFGMRIPGGSPLPHLRRAGVVCLTSAHSVAGLLRGYCGPAKPQWFKLATFPLAWLGKVSALRRTAAEIAVSHHDAAILRRGFRPWATKKVRVIYHSRITGQPSQKTRLRKKVILCAGHIAVRKGQHVLAEAFARIADRQPEWSLQIAGETVEAHCEQRIREITAHLGERVQLLGPRQDALALMADVEVFAQPSLEEALGLALQEALYQGCACVGTTAGGIPELIQHGRNGLLCPPNDPGALADALETLLEDGQLRNRFAQEGPAWILAHKMTAAQMVESHAMLYREFMP
jgi:glycosyltransferase involved in cell wall biosynthesis